MSNRLLKTAFYILLLLPLSKANADIYSDETADLWGQCEKARSLSNYEDLRLLADKLYRDGERHRNRRNQAYALFYQGLAELFSDETQASQQTLQRAADMAEEIGNDSVLALVANARGIYHAMIESNKFLAQQFFYRSLQLAEKSAYSSLKPRIYGNMLTMTQSDRDTTALANAFRILTRIIKEKTGMNYLQFVNSYRINEAIRILSDRQMMGCPLKQIWSDLGFNSPATFYKLFQQTVGMTPSVYRKQFLEIVHH